MQDLQLSKVFGLSSSTISDWKSNKTSSKYLLYKFMQSFNDEVIKNKIDAIKTVDDIEIVGTYQFRLHFFKNLNTIEQFKDFKVTGIDYIKSGIDNILVFKSDKNRYIIILFDLLIGSNNLKVDIFKKLIVDFKEKYEDILVDDFYIIVNNEKFEKIQKILTLKKTDLKIKVIKSTDITKIFYNDKNIIFWRESATDKREYYKTISKNRFL